MDKIKENGPSKDLLLKSNNIANEANLGISIDRSEALLHLQLLRRLCHSGAQDLNIRSFWRWRSLPSGQPVPNSNNWKSHNCTFWIILIDLLAIFWHLCKQTPKRGRPLICSALPLDLDPGPPYRQFCVSLLEATLGCLLQWLGSDENVGRTPR